MKYASILLVTALLMLGCNNRAGELEKQNATLQQQNQELANSLAAQDEYIDEVITAINDVSQSIEAARAREKNLLSETKDIEGTATRTKSEVRSELLDRIATVNENLAANRKKISDLQAKLNSSRKQYASLQTMVDNLRKTIGEREQSIAALEMRVRGLEGEVAEKAKMVAARDAVIDEQKKAMATVYYVVGTRDDLEKKGIIKKEGGFLWGLLGSTTTLMSGLDRSHFTPVDRNLMTSFRVDGKIDEILPKRSEGYYSREILEGNTSLLTIADVDHFWQDRYLVILTD